MKEYDMSTRVSGTIKALTEALEWHGEQARLSRLIHSEGDKGRNALARDGGRKAHEVLAAILARLDQRKGEGE